MKQSYERYEKSLAQKRDIRDSRALWEEVFAEDSKEFLDYYYCWIAPHNKMETRRHAGDLVSMIHWNPYILKNGNMLWKSYYLVAVATKKEFRHRGYMAGQLRDGFRRFYREEIPFLFLMPANKDIYLPFDFRFIYDKTEVELLSPADWTCRKGELTGKRAGETDYGQLAEFQERQLSRRYGIFTRRTEEYLRRMQAECESEGGALECMYEGERLVGCFSWWGSEEEIEVREWIMDETWEDLEHRNEAMALLCRMLPECQKVKVAASGWMGEKRPAIMGRIIHLPSFLQGFHSKTPISVRLQVEDSFIPENHGTFLWNLGPGETEVVKLPETSMAEMEPTEIGGEIGDLFQWLSGYLPAECCSQLWMTESGKKKAQEIEILSGVFLNEIV
ncbi:MAG: GNAT family N-acetyltransferase [Clostridiales bacterium]|nr:GNAT family N-acetyltransferase [Clostridiales bacterium]